MENLQAGPNLDRGMRNAADSPEKQRVDLRVEEQAIRGRESQCRSILASRDTAAIAAFYTEDAVYFAQREGCSART